MQHEISKLMKNQNIEFPSIPFTLDIHRLWMYLSMLYPYVESLLYQLKVKKLQMVTLRTQVDTLALQATKKDFECASMQKRISFLEEYHSSKVHYEVDQDTSKVESKLLERQLEMQSLKEKHEKEKEDLQVQLMQSKRQNILLELQCQQWYMHHQQQVADNEAREALQLNDQHQLRQTQKAMQEKYKNVLKEMRVEKDNVKLVHENALKVLQDRLQAMHKSRDAMDKQLEKKQMEFNTLKIEKERLLHDNELLQSMDVQTVRKEYMERMEVMEQEYQHKIRTLQRQVDELANRKQNDTSSSVSSIEHHQDSFLFDEESNHSDSMPNLHHSWPLVGKLPDKFTWETP